MKIAYQKASDIEPNHDSIDICSVPFKVIHPSNSDTLVTSANEASNSSCYGSSSTDTKKLLIISPVNAISFENLFNMLSLLNKTCPPVIISVSVPTSAPTSATQAKHWTETYWPTIYRKSNPFGPHHSIVSRAQKEIEGETSHWMKLAWELAKGSVSDENKPRRGEKIGAVIVERENGLGRIVAAAADARWHGLIGNNFIRGNPAAHAVMRAISIVATAIRQREKDQKKSNDYQYDSNAQPANPHDRCNIPTEAQLKTRIYSLKGSLKSFQYENSDSSNSKTISTNLESSSIFRDRPISKVEDEYFNPSANESGYLCHGLEIYITHEPCVMCSMAIVHSRFGRVVFEKRMPHSGGLTADGSLGYGLFWRQELNWTMLAWQWQDNHTEIDTLDDLDLEV